MNLFILLEVAAFVYSGHASRSSSSTALSRMPEVGTTVPTPIGDMRLTGELGKGSYGKVFKAFWADGGIDVAFKVELHSSSRDLFRRTGAPKDYTKIEHEFRMMHLMNGTEGFPRIYARDFSGRMKYYVMELLGPSLGSLRSKLPGKRIPRKQLAQIASQMVTRLEALHKKGFLMYDIHTGNFLIKKNTVYAIDLGMAYPYRYKDGDHVEDRFRPFIKSNMKNPHYVSRRDGLGRPCSRRDDFERILFVLVKLAIGSLPWDPIKSRLEISETKIKTPIADLCKGEASWLKPAFEHVYSLGFYDRPNYELLRSIFDKNA